MKKLYSPKTIKEIQEAFSFKFKKSLGQNFLADKNYVDKIIDLAEVEGENILEIGPGIGTITYELAQKAKKVLAIEIDRDLIPILRANLEEFSNVTIIQADILKCDLGALLEEEFKGEPFKVVSNLPYYITTPIIEKLVTEDFPCQEMTIMIQKEVADRIEAKENEKDYSSLSIFVKFYAEIIGKFKVPSSVFIPQPKVDSTVLKLRLRIYDEKVNRQRLFSLVRNGFNKRRKTILNSLSTGEDKEALKEAFERLSLSEKLRVENLSLDQLIALTNELEGMDK